MKRLFRAAATAAAVVVGAASYAPATQAAEPDVYKIGALLAMTGAGSYYGTVMSRGALLAVEEINAEGGIDGKKLELVIEDHQSGNANVSVAGFNRMISLHDVQAVLTSYSPPTLAVAPIADEKEVFLINGGGVSAALIGASKYLVHNRSLASDLAVGMIRRAQERGFKKMAMIVWKTDAGESVRSISSKLWEEMGNEVVAVETIVNGAPNIDTQVAKVRASRPDFIALGVFRPDPGLVLKRVRELGMKQPVMGIEYTPDDEKIAGAHAEGYEFTNDHFAATDDNPWGQAFHKAYQEKFDQEPDFYAANYYEAIYTIAELIRRSKAKGGEFWNGARLKAALDENPSVKSVYGGDMMFQENGVAAKRVGLFEVKDGQKSFIKFVETAN